MRTNRSPIIVLKNMIGTDDADDEELEAEIRDECEKFGAVSEASCWPIHLKVFIQISMCF